MARNDLRGQKKKLVRERRQLLDVELLIAAQRAVDDKLELLEGQGNLAEHGHEPNDTGRRPRARTERVEEMAGVILAALVRCRHLDERVDLAQNLGKDLEAAACVWYVK